MAESIYNIITPQNTQPPKQPLYRSKFPSTIPPTGSTFGLHTTSKTLGVNLNGDFSSGLQAHTEHGKTKTFGHLKGDRKPSPGDFLKKQTGTMGNETLPPVRNFSYDCKHKKETVPTVHDKPVQGQRSNKNFIISNAIENILSVPKKHSEDKNWLKKKDYGKNPEYLNKIKDNMEYEYRLMQTLHLENENKVPSLSQQQVNEIKEGLKRKWNEVNHEYQKLTHVKLVDTIGLKARKEGYQKELQKIEKDIKKLNKAYIFINE